MPHVSDEVGHRRNLKHGPSDQASRHRLFVWNTCCGMKKIRYCLLDFSAAISIRDKQHSIGLILKNASLENKFIWPLETKNFVPFRRLPEESAYAKRRTPVEIASRIVSISQNSRDWDDALMLIVGKGDENMDYARLGLPGSDARNT